MPDSTVPEPSVGPLDGIRILTLENLVAGPLTTMMLGDWGAEVIKIEPPGGDLYRGFQRVTDDEGRPTSFSFARVNRNKKSVQLDLRSPEGHSRFMELAADADVVVQNLRPGALARLGIGYEVLRAAFPRIILVSLSGFGQPEISPGQYSGMPSLDLVGQAMTGLALTAGDESGPPRYLGFPLVDTATADWAAIGVLLALRWRDMTGKGQHVDVAMYDVAMHLNEYHLGGYASTGVMPPRGRLGSSAPFDFYQAADGWFALAVSGEPIWQRLCDILGRHDLAEDPGLASGIKRAAQPELLREAIEAWSCDLSVAEVCRVLNASDVPSSSVQDAAGVNECPHANARGAWVGFDDPVLGPVRAVASPLHSDSMPAPPVRRAPTLGEHLGWDRPGRPATQGPSI